MNEQEVMGIKQGESLSKDSSRYETDTKYAVERLYYSWLGQVPNINGVYERDHSLIKRMNSKGASFLKSEILSRFYDNMNFSELTDNEIVDISSETAENIVSVLKYEYDVFDIKVEDIKPLCDQVYHFLVIALKIAKNGGMKLYKVQKERIIINKLSKDGEESE